MPIVKTREYGEINVSEQNKIIFKKPIFGFENLLEYYLIPLQEPVQFALLQSAEDQDISFIVTQPRLFISDYLLDIDDKDAAMLEMSEGDEIADYAIVTIPQNVEDITMNILGPIVINTKNNYAVQSVSNCEHYTTRCGLFQKETQKAAQ